MIGKIFSVKSKSVCKPHQVGRVWNMMLMQIVKVIIKFVYIVWICIGPICYKLRNEIVSKYGYQQFPSELSKTMLVNNFFTSVNYLLIDY